MTLSDDDSVGFKAEKVVDKIQSSQSCFRNKQKGLVMGFERIGETLHCIDRINSKFLWKFQVEALQSKCQRL